jgi:hypothetical protein
MGDSNFRTIAMYAPMYAPQSASQSGLAEKHEGVDCFPPFEYEEIEIGDVADWLDTILATYPAHDIVMKIDSEPREYYIDGVSVYQLLQRLHCAGKLMRLTMIMLRWNQKRPTQSIHVITRQLAEWGFKIFLFNPCDPHAGLLYAVRGNNALACQVQ